MSSKGLKRCAGGFPERNKRCENAPGPRNPVWCDSCDLIRTERLSRQINALTKASGIKEEDKR